MKAIFKSILEFILGAAVTIAIGVGVYFAGQFFKTTPGQTMITLLFIFLILCMIFWAMRGLGRALVELFECIREDMQD